MYQDDSLIPFIRRHIGIPLLGITFKRILPFAIGMSLLTANALHADSRQALIVPKAKADAHADAQPESFDSYQIRILRNQNQIQAEKIKALREELAEVSSKLHELKPRLFTQGDPADHAKIATLGEKLKEKESLTNQLNAAKNALETEFSAVRRKLTELETVKEALTAMIEKQRFDKDQHHADFNRQIEEVRAAASLEKSKLLKTIQQHAEQVESLQTALNAKTEDANRLDDVATRLSATVSSKHEELLAIQARLLAVYQEMTALSEQHATKEQASQVHAQNLSSVLEKQRKENEELQAFREEMKWMSDLFQGSQAILSNQIDNLNAKLHEELARRTELAALKADLEGKYAELSKNLNGSETARKEALSNIQALSESFEKEQARTQELEQEIFVLLSHQDAGHTYAAALENLVKELDAHLSTQRNSQQLSETDNLHKTGALLHHLDTAEATLEANEAAQKAWLTKEKLLKNGIQDAYANYEETVKKADKLTATISSLEDQLAVRNYGLLVLGGYLLEVQAQHDADLQVQQTAEKNRSAKTVEEHQAALRVLHEQLSAQKAAFDAETQQATHEEIVLSHTIQTAHELVTGASRFSHEAAVKSFEDKLAALQIIRNAEAEAIHSSHAASVKSFEDKLAALQVIRNAEAEAIHSSHEASVKSFEDQIAKLDTALNLEAERSTHLEMLLQEAAWLAQDHSQSLEQHQKLLAERMQEITALRQDNAALLDKAEKQVLSLRDNLETQTGLTRHLALEVNSKNEELNQRLRDREIELNDKQSVLEGTEKNLDEVKAAMAVRLEEIGKALEVEKAQVASLETQIEQFSFEHEKSLKHKEELETLVRDLSRDLTEKQQLLTLTEDKAATTDYDNQALAKQNRELAHLQSSTALNHAGSLDLVLAQATTLEALQQDLKIAQETIQQLAGSDGQVAVLRSLLADKESIIAALEKAKEEIEGDRIERVTALEQALAKELSLRALTERDLEYARMNYTAERRSLLNLEQIARESMSKSAILEKEVKENSERLASNEDDLHMLTLDKSDFEQDLLALSQKLEEVLAQEKSVRDSLAAEMETSKKLSDEAIVLAKLVEERDAALDKHHTARQDAEERLASLEEKIALHEAELAKQQEVKSELNEKIAFIEALQEQMQLLEQKLQFADQTLGEKVAAIAAAEERAGKIQAHNLEILAENERLLNDKNELERKHFDALQQKIQDSATSKDDEEDRADLGRSRLQRVNDLKQPFEDQQ